MHNGLGDKETRKHLFCFGYGYCCDYLSSDLMLKGGWKISGTTRDSDKKRSLRARNINAHIFDDDCPLADPLYMMGNVTHLLISTPPDDDGDPVFNIHAQDILRLKNLEWVGYFSTTGAYGDRGGKWVDETSEVRPSTKRGSRRAKAEEQWLSLFKGFDLPVHIFRLSGVYGPGRSAIDSVRAGIARRIDKPGHAFSRIHVEDIVQTLQASFDHPAPGEVYNVCDDMPAPSHEVISCACELLDIEPPPLLPYDKVDLAPIARSFYADNKRVRNDKIKKELGIELKHKNYKDGLRACLDAEDDTVSMCGS